MQPFQCDLQPQLQETHRTTHTGTTIVAKHIEGTKRPQPHPPHTRGTSRYLSSPAAATLHGITQGFVLRLPPHKTHGMQHSCSHSNAICNHSFKQSIELRRQEQHGTTTRCRTQRRNQSRPERPQSQPPHTRGTFHRRLQPLYTENYKVSCSGFLHIPHATLMQHSLPTTSLRHHPSSRSVFFGWCIVNVLLCSAKSHTTLHQGQFFCDVLLCSVKSHTTLHQGQVSIAHHPSS